VQPDWVSTVAGRIGFTGPGFDHWLFYAKGGGGWIQASATINTRSATFSESRTASGWMAGGGIEWAFAPNWTARIDYQFIGLENTTVAPPFLSTRSLLGTPTFKLRPSESTICSIGARRPRSYPVTDSGDATVPIPALPI
jgi:opacity protein-like surface antigen